MERQEQRLAALESEPDVRGGARGADATLAQPRRSAPPPAHFQPRGARRERTEGDGGLADGGDDGGGVASDDGGVGGDGDDGRGRGRGGRRGEDDESTPSLSTASLLDIMAGDSRLLPCDHVEDNPFPRAPALRARACHYSPSAAGDSLHGEIHSALKRISKDTAHELVKVELSTLVPVCSILYDLQGFIDSAADAAGDDDVARAFSIASQQLHAARELTTERLDELAGAAHGRLERAAHADIMYGQERTLTGARSALGNFIALSTTTRSVSSHVGGIARDRVSGVRGTPVRPGGDPRLTAATLLGGAPHTVPRSPQAPREGDDEDEYDEGGDGGVDEDTRADDGVDPTLTARPPGDLAAHVGGGKGGYSSRGGYGGRGGSRG